MEALEQVLYQPKWRILDRSRVQPDQGAIHSFAVEDTLCTYVGLHQDFPTVHIWAHAQTIVLGQVDTRLANFQQGVAYLRQAGFEVLLRNSGGAAVVLDPGVLNISLIMPTQGALNSINNGYELLYLLLQQALAPLDQSIEAGEIHGSYCPGSYDLSIAGKKITGIAQRRRRGAVAVQAFLNVSGSGAQRAELVKRFYEQASRSSDRSRFPQIIPSQTASLAELSRRDLHPEWVKQQILSTLERYSRKQVVVEHTLSSDTLDEYRRNLEQLIKRNDQYHLL